MMSAKKKPRFRSLKKALEDLGKSIHKACEL